MLTWSWFVLVVFEWGNSKQCDKRKGPVCISFSSGWSWLGESFLWGIWPQMFILRGDHLILSSHFVMRKWSPESTSEGQNPGPEFCLLICNIAACQVCSFWTPRETKWDSDCESYLSMEWYHTSVKCYFNEKCPPNTIIAENCSSPSGMADMWGRGNQLFLSWFSQLLPRQLCGGEAQEWEYSKSADSM